MTTVFIPHEKTGGDKGNGNVMTLVTQCQCPIDLFHLLTVWWGTREEKMCREEFSETCVTTEVTVAKTITILSRTGGYRGPFYIFVSWFNIISSLSR